MRQPCRTTAFARFIHTRETRAHITTCVTYGTMGQHGRIFTDDPELWYDSTNR